MLVIKSVLVIISVQVLIQCLSSNIYKRHVAVDTDGAEAVGDLNPHFTAFAPASAPRVLNGPEGGVSGSHDPLHAASLLGPGAAPLSSAPLVFLIDRVVRVFAELVSAPPVMFDARWLADFLSPHRDRPLWGVLAEHDGVVERRAAVHVARDYTPAVVPPALAGVDGDG